MTLKREGEMEIYRQIKGYLVFFLGEVAECVFLNTGSSTFDKNLLLVSLRKVIFRYPIDWTYYKV